MSGLWISQLQQLINNAAASHTAPDYPNPLSDDNYGTIRTFIESNWSDMPSEVINDQYEPNVYSLLFEELLNDRRNPVLNYLWGLIIEDRPD